MRSYDLGKGFVMKNTPHIDSDASWIEPAFLKHLEDNFK